MASNLGVRLRAAREAQGLSREQLAVAAGLSSGTLVRIEGGFSPLVSTLEAIAEQLGTTAAELLTDDEPEAVGA